ncbi:site-specific integrase [Segniliparus rugosus]|uniref:Site-specific integrase n=1 Tax=Segniliparus rugosus (strain ATCC BAA-974 / DSM 45345 / CCUG 50838 / CIP 108380 / JCM 13579 / CDC 945) TaxID=679197 RepID=E5XT26_SEGRC|nr:site-specific integrase [Segniliparus rugosus]EFV12497.1 hypothetical protein HMPREF9336_02648 [Segniliparus rugosus ATCC BAA-974]
MRGSVKKTRGGTWYYVVDLGPDPTSGKRRQERKRGFRIKDDAEDALTERLAEIRQGVHVDRSVTVAAYLRDWIDAKEAAGLRAKTVKGYRQHIDTHLVPHLGHIKLRDLRATHIEKMLREIAKPPKQPAPNEKIATGKHRKLKPLSASSIRRVHATLSSALGAAKRKRLISFNAAADSDRPAATRPKVRPWEPHDLGLFLDHAASERFGPMYEVAALTGLRRGELCGMRWDDLDFERSVFVVRQQLVVVSSAGIACPYCQGQHKQFRFSTPKTASGEARIVDLDAATVGVLMAQRLAQDAEREEWGDLYVDHGLVFAREDGNPTPPDDVTERFNKLTDDLGLRRIRLHDLRHGQASLMLAAGVEMAVVSKRLGHSRHAFTSDTYSHLLGGVGASAAEKAAALVPRAGRPKAAPEGASQEAGDQSVITALGKASETKIPQLRNTV